MAIATETRLKAPVALGPQSVVAVTDTHEQLRQSLASLKTDTETPTAGEYPVRGSKNNAAVAQNSLPNLLRDE